MKKRMMTLLMNVTFNINFSSASATTLCKTKYQLHVQTCQKLVNSIVSVVLPLISELSIMTVHYGNGSSLLMRVSKKRFTVAQQHIKYQSLMQIHLK